MGTPHAPDLAREACRRIASARISGCSERVCRLQAMFQVGRHPEPLSASLPSVAWTAQAGPRWDRSCQVVWRRTRDLVAVLFSFNLHGTASAQGRRAFPLPGAASSLPSGRRSVRQPRRKAELPRRASSGCPMSASSACHSVRPTAVRELPIAGANRCATRQFIACVGRV